MGRYCCNVVERWNMSLQIKELIHLHAAFSVTEFRPVEHGKAEGDSRGIEGIGVFHEHEHVLDAFLPFHIHHEESEILEYAVVSLLVGDEKRVSRGWGGPEAEMVAF